MTARDRPSLTDLASALETNRTGAVEGAVQFEKLDSDLGEVTVGILAALLAGRKAAAEEISGPGLGQVSERIQTAVTQQGALAVARVTDASRQSIRLAVSRILNDELSYEEGAKEIRRVIGLTPRQTVGLQAQRAAMKAAGATDRAIEKALEARSKQMLDYRASVIADNEAWTAIGAGRRMYWLDLADGGDIPQTTKRTWNTAQDERVCPICAPMHGATTGLTGFYTLPDGSLISGTPAHVVCRCYETLVE